MATQPTLAMIPSGYKDGSPNGTLYSVLPTDGVGDFDVTRGSNATRINKDGLIETVSGNTPRLDYTGGGCPSLLLEPQSKNLLTYSEAFDNAYWTKSGSSVTSGFISPTGALGAFKLVEDSILSTKSIKTSNFTSVNGQEYTISIFAKPNGRILQITPSTAFIQRYINYDLDSGTMDLSGAGDAFGTITLLNNGYYRCTYTASANASSTVANIFYCLVDSPTATRRQTYTGNGTSGVYIFGAQLEQKSYATSYIPNFGTALGVTRLAETANNAGDAATFNDSEGVLFVEMNAFDNTSRISLSDGSTINRVSFKITDGNIDFQYRVGGIYSYRVDVNVDNSNTNKIAMSFNNGVFVGYLNGVAIGSPISGASLGQGVLDRLNFNDGGSSDNFNGNVKDLRVYSTALTSLEIETLTSYSSFNEMALNFNYTI